MTLILKWQVVVFWLKLLEPSWEHLGLDSGLCLATLPQVWETFGKNAKRALGVLNLGISCDSPLFSVYPRGGVGNSSVTPTALRRR